MESMGWVGGGGHAVEAGQTEDPWRMRWVEDGQGTGAGGQRMDMGGGWVNGGHGWRWRMGEWWTRMEMEGG